MNSGTKLVLSVIGLAVLAGLLSWIYRYRAAHDSTQFWGPNFARLIAEPSQVTAFQLGTEQTKEAEDGTLKVLDKTYYRILPEDITSVRGLVHLRHSILTDSNYRWDHPVQTDEWRWCLQFAENDLVATILFNPDFSILGRLNRRGDQLRQVDCLPMAETLREYFAGAGIFAASKQPE